MVRHGQSTDNAAGRIQGRTDVSVLTDAGRQMARKVAPALRGISIDHFYSSPLQRAAQTAQEIADLSPHLPPIEKHEQLTEIDLRLWERMLKSDIEAQYPEAYHLWLTNPSALCMELPSENGPIQHYPVQSLYDRIEGFWQEILPQHQGQTVLIVAHNGVIRALISTALGLGADRYQVLRQSNCGLNVLNFAGGWGEQVQLESMNLTAHLDQPLPSRQSAESIRLLLVRHGETDWNRQSRFQGQIDIPLNENGKAQAEKAAEFLKAVPIDEAVTSPMARPRQTAEVILRHHPELALQADDRLKEIGGIGPKRAERITSAWADQKVIREIMVFLHEHGVGTARA
ncbi:MAG: histidine phosphatase family protein, partial [Cyanobacteria bacterium P01_H01_bin.121]